MKVEEKMYLTGLKLLSWVALFWQTGHLLSGAEELPVPTNNQVLLVPIEGPITSTQEYILRRSLKFAQKQSYAGVILNINTPGGRLDSTLKMIEILEKYQGPLLAYINREAISAGSYLAMGCNAIYFHPKGVMGTAAVVGMQGQEIDKTMKLKIDSYLRARMRILTKHVPYRSDIQRAMMDEAFVLKIDERVIKPAGELLSLTAEEAAQLYGQPPRPLLSDGTLENSKDVAKAFFGKKMAIIPFELTGFEHLAKWLQAIAPLLIGIGLLCLWIEFQTPGFGIFGVSGLLCFSLVLMGNYLAGLSGYEGWIALGVGLFLLLLDIGLLGTLVVGALGGVVVLFALVWSKVDFWISEPLSIEKFLTPLRDVGLGLLILAILIFVLWKLGILKSGLRKLQLTGTIGTKSSISATRVNPIQEEGIALTPLIPSGKIRVKNEVFEARMLHGMANPGDKVVVVGKKDFEWVVKKQ